MVLAYVLRARPAPRPMPTFSERPHPLQIDAWRHMGADRRTQCGVALRAQVRRWKSDALRAQHPAWSETQVLRDLALIYLRGNT